MCPHLFKQSFASESLVVLNTLELFSWARVFVTEEDSKNVEAIDETSRAKWLDQEAILPIPPPLNACSRQPEQSTRGLALFFGSTVPQRPNCRTLFYAYNS
jgi:hypothetical protein